MAGIGSATQQPPVEQPAPQEQQPVSFREAVAATQQRDEQRLNDLATSAGATPVATDPAAPASAPQQPGISPAQQQAIETAVGDMSQEQFEAWYKAQPEGALKRAAKNIADFMGAQMREQFGDLLQLGDLANADPRVKKKLERLVKDPNAREFILNRAFEIFDPAEFGQAPQPQTQQPYSQPVTPEQVQGIVSDTLAQERQRIAYEADRSRELEALVREAPALNWTSGDDSQKQKAARKVAHIIEVAEKRTRETGSRVSYRTIADELDMIGSANPPQPVPQTSSTSTPPARDQQAPRNEVEARQRMSKLLEQHGGLMGLAAALPTRRG